MKDCPLYDFVTITANDHGLLLCRYLKNGQPGN
jgi:hypothetical protein